MHIVRYSLSQNNIKITKMIMNNKSKSNNKSKINCEGKINGGVHMENVVLMEKYIENTQTDECEWDMIRNIFQKAIKRKGLTKEQVRETSEKMLREVREEK